ncbi:MAG: ATP-dependent metallopeptidase FtsH/Yme1/Tma family protein, partial [Ferruginibacter sp.]
MDNDKKNSKQPRTTPSERRTRWLMYLLLLSFLILPSLINSYSSTKEIAWQQFENNMLSRKAVEKINIINNERAEIYIKNTFAGDSMFKEVFKPAFGKGLYPGPHYVVNIGSIESFERKLDDAE